MRTGLFAAMSVLGAGLSAHANLLRNGDFEVGGASGWITWRADWGQQERWKFNDATPGRSGNYDLKITALGGSFGVYQTVTVAPGSFYRLEAKWKATVLSDPAWFEIELLQGPWNYEAADIRPGDLVNKMYSFDNPENPPVSFDWIDTGTLDGTAADINGYRGVRQATSNRMTVVLKAGGNPNMVSGQSVVSWFDDVNLYEVPEPSSILLLAAGLGAVAPRRRRPCRAR
jgi:hypothetical protein